MNTFLTNFLHFLVGSLVLVTSGGALLGIYWTIVNYWWVVAALFIGAVAWLIGYMIYHLEPKPEDNSWCG